MALLLIGKITISHIYKNHDDGKMIDRELKDFFSKTHCQYINYKVIFPLWGVNLRALV